MTDDARAREFMGLLVAHRFADAAGRFNGKMKAALPADKLQQVWQTLQSQVGPFQELTGTRSEAKDTHEIVHVTCKFQHATLDAKVVFDPDHQITGLFFAPGAGPTTVGAESWSPPPYVKREAFEEKEIAIGSGAWQLPGTLTLPVGAGPFPAVVLVHGSGPNDRDETLGPNKPFRDLAWGLASRGVAVVRYEKRTKVHAARLVGVDLTVKEEVIDDAVAALAAARAAARIDPRRVFVLGHSLGGYLAPRILKADASTAGAILLAGSARPMQDLIIEQMEYISRIDGTVSKEEAASIEAIKTDLAKLKEPSFSASSPPVFGIPASYWIDLQSYDPVATAKTLDRPLLILQGGRDYQVTSADFSLWERGLGARKRCKLHLYPDLNHLFAAGTGKSTPDEYAVEGQHVAAEVVDDIAGWITRRPAR